MRRHGPRGQLDELTARSATLELRWQFTFLPLLLIGWGTFLRRPAAIWAGVFVLPTIMAFCLAMVLG